MKAITRSLCLLATLTSALPAQAIVRRHDRSDASYRQLAAQLAFSPVGFVELSGGFCSATLIAPDWALTAAHCVTGGRQAIRFSLGNRIIPVTGSVVYPTWTGDLEVGNDIALVHLAQAVTGIEPATLLKTAREVGEQAVLVGYGQSGNGFTGASTSSGIKRAGQNRIDFQGDALTNPVYRFGSSLLLCDFDDPSGSADTFDVFGAPGGAVSQEGCLAPGDSGGGLFLQEGGEWVLAGVHSFVGTFGAPFDDGVPDSDYGDFMGATRVSAYTDWIRTTAGITSAPEPGTGALALPFLVGRVWRRRHSLWKERD